MDGIWSYGNYMVSGQWSRANLMFINGYSISVDYKLLHKFELTSRQVDLRMCNEHSSFNRVCRAADSFCH